MSSYSILLRKNHGCRTGKWSQAEEQCLSDSLNELMKQNGIEHPKDFNKWTELSLLVGTRDSRQCRKKITRGRYHHYN